MTEFHNLLPAGLSVERRKCRLYLYARVRVAGRLRARYVGPIGPLAAAALVVRAGVERECLRAAARNARDRSAAVLVAGALLDRVADQLTRTAMWLGGFHLHHRGQWRKRREETPPMAGVTDDDDLDQDDAPPVRPARSPRPPHLPVDPGNQTQAELFAQAARGDPEALPGVRKLLENPRNLRFFGDLADHARLALVDRVAGDHLVVAEAVRGRLTEVEAGFLADAGPDPTFAERVAAGRAAHAWVTVHHLEVLLAKERVGTPGRAAVEKDLSRAERRLQAALRGMATLRRLRGPAVRLTQVNVSGAEKVVVR
ncbi:MAG TPA: hypothetical protein VH092_18445 [Urbifossiella sp.]|jgi:hypothetical protein|nr:hypothetical protein [Urbifossiella sp.]